MRPVILLTCGRFGPAGTARPVGGRIAAPARHAEKLRSAQACLKVEYIRSVERAGGAPLVLPNSTEPGCTGAAVRAADGLVLTGGGDVAPERYGQARHPSVERVDPVRDAAEQAAVEEAMRAGAPILAICRGMQMLNVALGGTLIQDIPSLPGRRDGASPASESSPGCDHNGPDHPVRVEAGSTLAAIWGKLGRTVNSRHHQAVEQLAPSLRATARAPDGIIEAAESADGYPLLALQCHPEELIEADGDFLAPFRWLVEEAARRRG